MKAWRRARFANTVRLLTDLDEDGLKYVLKNLPAWVKVCPCYLMPSTPVLICGLAPVLKGVCTWLV